MIDVLWLSCGRILSAEDVSDQCRAMIGVLLIVTQYMVSADAVCDACRASNCQRMWSWSINHLIGVWTGTTMQGQTCRHCPALLASRHEPDLVCTEHKANSFACQAFQPFRQHSFYMAVLQQAANTLQLTDAKSRSMPLLTALAS